ncbi:MAG: hypothetical protein ACRECH_08020 [Nitrososphaerales archaeon]
MSRSNNSRLASVIIASILIVFAFLAILSANSLAWPLGLQVGSNNKNGSPPPPTGELVVSASLTSYNGFTLNGTTIIAQPFYQPLPGVNVTVFALNQARPAPAFTKQTNDLGSLALNLTQGTYSVHLNTFYSNLSAQVSIVSNHVTYFTLNVNGTQLIASFYDLRDADSIGQVLPSESVYIEISGQQQINSSQSLYLSTYGIPPIIFRGTVSGNTSIPNVAPANFYQNQQVPATIVWTYSTNNSLWVEARPQSPLNIFNVQYVGLEQFTATYNISNSSSGVPPPIV